MKQVPVSGWMDIEDVIYIYNEILLSHENPAICNNRDRHEGHYAKWATSDKNSVWYHLYVEYLKKLYS